MARILILCGILMVFLAACSSGYDSDVCHFEAALLRHEAVLEVEAVTVSENVIDTNAGLIAMMGLEPRETIIYRIRYESDGYQVMGYAIAPIDFMDYRYPILIYNRGGNRTLGMLTPEHIIGLGMSGYIVLASQYRGVAGGTGMEQFGGDDINDVLRLIDIGESFDFAQQGGVYMYGDSRGGMMTYIASRMDDRIVAAAVWADPTNLFDNFRNRESAYQAVLTQLIGGRPEQLPEEYERRSAVFWADEINVPLLIGHGDNDQRVLYHHAVSMAEALERYGKPHRLIIYPGAGHYQNYLIETGFLLEVHEWFRQHPIGN